MRRPVSLVADGRRRLSPFGETLEARPRSIAERMAAGKSLRTKVPRKSHAALTLAGNRDPVGIILDQAKSRLAELVPIRHARMLTSPFAFLRGSAAVMAADIAPAPVTGLTVQACGDMHVSNFGVFASAERNLVFGINDFDEALPGHWEWDVKRRASSALVCARYVGGDKTACEAAARQAVRSYRERMRRYAEFGYLDLWYERIDGADVLETLSRKARRAAERIMAKA